MRSPFAFLAVSPIRAAGHGDLRFSIPTLVVFFALSIEVSIFSERKRIASFLIVGTSYCAGSGDRWLRPRIAFGGGSQGSSTIVFFHGGEVGSASATNGSRFDLLSGSISGCLDRLLPKDGAPLLAVSALLVQLREFARPPLKNRPLILAVGIVEECRGRSIQMTEQ